MRTTTSLQQGKPFAWSKQKGKRFVPAKSLADCGAVYWRAAQALSPAMAILNDSFGSYPLVFLYRHAIEAYVKAILNEFGPGAEITRKEVRERRHDLCKQMPDLLRVSQLIGPGVSRRTTDAINQINGIDPGADSFRYDTLPHNQGEFDVQHFVNESESILEELAETYNQLSDSRSEDIEREIGILD